ncbi:MAG: EAL domain-containing protein [Gammaproteobacteria bacterium]
MLNLVHYHYNVFAIPTAVTMSLVLFMGVQVFMRERRSNISVLFLLITLLIGAGFFAFTWMYLAADPGMALTWAKLAYLAVPFIPSAIYHFSVVVLHLFERRKILVWTGWALSAIFASLSVGSDALISQVYDYWWGYYPKYGMLGAPFLLFYFGMSSLALYDYWKEYRKAIAGTHKLRIKWLMLAFSIFYLSTIDYLAHYGIPIYPAGYLPVFLFLLVASLSIKRYRLVDLSPEFAAGQILETIQGAVLVVDLLGGIRVVNRAACTMLGYRKSELLGQSLTMITEAPFDARILPQRVLREGAVHDQEMPWRRKNNGHIDVTVAATAVADRDNFPVGIVYVAFDITERKRAEEAEAREERYALAVRGARDGLWDWNLKTNEVFFSERWKSMLGCGEDEIGMSPDDWFKRIHAEEVERVRMEIDVHLGGHTPHYESEYRMLHKDGTYRWILCRGVAVRDGEGRASRIAGSQTDVTERKLTTEQLAHQALYDPLTNLPNRALFADILKRALARAKRDENYTFGVLFLDLDRFKVINDSLGHLIGDQLLINISRRLESCLRPTDTVARFGGDEFTLLLDDIPNAEEAMLLAHRLQDQIVLPFNFKGHEIYTTASIGIALNTPDYHLPEEMLRDADTAMYRAKSLGKARSEIFNDHMHAAAIGLWQMEADLRRALERGEFRIHYQPIVSLVSGKITGAEALLRWQHPQRELIYPVDFIPLAEETGLIKSIGYWLLRMACTQNMIWRKAGYSLRMAVNVSTAQFQDHTLLELVRTVLTDTGMPAQSLELEITESIAMSNAEFGMITLNALSDMGVHISIDDFGTGYSSLAYLKRFPINNLKIDQSFLKDVANDNDNGALTRAIITMGHSLKLNVIAEGVETEEQLAFLLAQGCDEMQGYFFSRPVPAETFTGLLLQEQRLPPLRQRRENSTAT